MQGDGSSILVWEAVCAGSWAPAAGSGSAARQEFLSSSVNQLLWQMIVLNFRSFDN